MGVQETIPSNESRCNYDPEALEGLRTTAKISKDEDWIHGRTVSEEMILRAGARCLRSRGMSARP